jgi:hypothetical protein
MAAQHPRQRGVRITSHQRRTDIPPVLAPQHLLRRDDAVVDIARHVQLILLVERDLHIRVGGHEFGDGDVGRGAVGEGEGFGLVEVAAVELPYEGAGGAAGG